MTDQTWIIIVLILISIIVTISEVFLRFSLLHAREGAASPTSIIARAMGRSIPSPPSAWLPYNAPNTPPGCVCPSLAPAAGGPDMSMSGIWG